MKNRNPSRNAGIIYSGMLTRMTLLCNVVDVMIGMYAIDSIFLFNLDDKDDDDVSILYNTEYRGNYVASV